MATRTFDAACWLSNFADVGGAYTVTDRLNLFISVPGRTDDELSRARQLIVDLSCQDRVDIISHLERKALAALGEG